jgi:DNA-directed RNA polymerase subunit D
LEGFEAVVDELDGSLDFREEVPRVFVMKVRMLERSEGRVVFILEGALRSFANALRRIIIAEVPCMAIYHVVIYENSSVMEDEILAHRLGLIPLKTDLNAYRLPEECECKSEAGCKRCRVRFSLEVRAEEPVVVCSGDLKSENSATVPVSPHIPIVKLARGQGVALEAYAKLGRGKEHARWQPVSVCAYKNLPLINVKEDKCDACGKCVKLCPKRLLKIENGKLVVSNSLLCTLCEDCERACVEGAIKVFYDKSSFVFNVESTGVLSAEELVERAAEILKKKASEFGAQVSRAL